MGKPDPSVNVFKLVKADSKRLDDLRCASEKKFEEIIRVHFDYQKELRKAETERLDAIRGVDMAAVSLASDRAITQATVLAKQVTDSAQMLAIQLQAMESKLTDRITSLENSQFQNQGKSSLTSNLIITIVGVVSTFLGIIIAKYFIK